MSVVSHGCLGLDGDWDGGGVWHACGAKPGRMSGDAGPFPESVMNTLIIPDHSTIHVRNSG